MAIVPSERFKTTFVVPNRQYHWTVLSFGLKNAPYEFQKRMEDVFRHLNFVIVYIDDLLVFSEYLQEHKIRLEAFYELVYKHGLVLSSGPDKFFIAQTKITILVLSFQRER